MKNPTKTAKYKVVLKDRETGYLVETERWYFADQDSWGFNNKKWELDDYILEPIEGTSKEEWLKLNDSPHMAFEELRAAIFRQAIEDATINVVTKKKLAPDQRILKDSARRWLHFKKYDWLAPDEIRLDEIRMNYRKWLVTHKKKRHSNGRGCRKAEVQ